ncbi:ADP-ribosylation factor-like protein 8B [Neolecta irregularis DAH-3]|uniref:ADP-ribosylation factor-like protein 8B n=1 Tax=Neolecta irregularis (strain DAH-3) TaxID=1198029 RepID=A0A1U7LRZ8_NEOID|nr:ADP-ribosylation factor-like protein 8B [Neolecta irregularis DAH-3]|eukprot:OLL25398.1 ADP-ribosylation factor-like protein 8B [Neolecta irregularis DAH-3]
MWDRYCRGINAIVFVIDSSDHDKLATSAAELHNLLSKPALDLIPLLVLANKRDMPKALTVDEVIEQMYLNYLESGAKRHSRLDSIKGREVSCYSISAKDNLNIEPIISWLVARAKR